MAWALRVCSVAGLLFAGDEHPHDPEPHPLAPSPRAGGGPGGSGTGGGPGRRQRMAAWRSALLLVSRLALSALLLFSGAMQVGGG